MSDKLLPHGESLRRAIQWLSEQKSGSQPAPEGQVVDIRDLIEKASIRFDLTPNDEAFLLRHFSAPEDKA